jgi:hypothetical protein
MDSAFSANVWNWYAENEYVKLLSFLQLCSGLEFLALEAPDQIASIPYCPACEVWSEKILRIKFFIDDYESAITIQLKEELISVFELCNNLSNDAFHCDDQYIFNHDEWKCIRLAATNALESLEWNFLKPYAAEFEGRAKNVLFGSPFQET